MISSNIQKFLNPFIKINKEPKTQTEKFINDCHKLNFSKIFTNKNEYSNLKSFKLMNKIINTFLLACKKDFDLVYSKLDKFSEFLMNFKFEEENLNSKNFVFIFFYLLENIFLKENWVGPSFLSIQAEKVLKKELEIKNVEKYNINYDGIDCNEILDIFDISKDQFEKFNFKEIKNENFLKTTSKKYREHLALNGIDYKESYKLLNFFIFYKQTLFNVIKKEEFNNQTEFLILYARTLNLHTQILDNQSEDLRKGLNDYYTQILDRLKDLDESHKDFKSNLKLYCFMKIEYSLILLEYYKYAESKKLILESMNLLGIEINFTGKLGIRTKFQTFKIPQLVVEINNKEKIEETDETKETENKAKVLKLDEIFDNILHEKPILDDKTFIDRKLTIEENIIIIALIKNTVKSFAMDEMLRNQLTAYLSKSIESLSNWSMTIVSLLYRTTIEFKIIKKMERAMLQCESIVNDWKSKKIPLYDRVKYSYFLNFPNYLNIISEFAENYKSINSYMSAAALLEECGLLEEAMESKAICGNQDQALILYEKLDEERKNSPKMMCILGDIYKDIKYYEKALKISDNKSLRALNALGSHYFKKQNLEESLKYYTQAVKLNEMNLFAWKNMGFIYMRMKNNEESIRCYQRALFINKDAEIWGNLSVLFANQNKNQKALNAIKEATQLNGRNWAMWSNMMTFALRCHKYNDFVKACLKIIDLGQALQIKDFFLIQFYGILQKVFSVKNDENSIRQVELLLISTKKVFEILKKVRYDSETVWIEYTRILDFEIEVTERKEELINSKKIVMKNFVDKVNNFDERYKLIIKEIMECFKKRAFSLMNIGWFNEKTKCEKVLSIHKLSLEYLNDNKKSFEDYANQKTSIEMHIKTVNDFLKKF